MRLRGRLVGALAGSAALISALVLAAGPAAAATSYWTVYNATADGTGHPLCVSAPAAGGWATVGACSGDPAQDWAFSNGSQGEFLLSRARPGYVMALSSLSVGAHLTLARLDPTDPRQIFAVGDPMRSHYNHIRPYYSPGLCLEARPWRTNLASVMLGRCDTSATGPQAWLSRFHGNY
jgi:hypothetical protein